MLCQCKDILRSSQYDYIEVTACSFGVGNIKKAVTSTINSSALRGYSYYMGTPHKGSVNCLLGWAPKMTLHSLLNHCPVPWLKSEWQGDVTLALSMRLWLHEKYLVTARMGSWCPSQINQTSLFSFFFLPLFNAVRFFKMYWFFFEWENLYDQTVASLLALGGVFFSVKALLQNQLC